MTIKKTLLNPVVDSQDSYSNEQFESMAESKTLSNEEKIKCFVCKQQIPKSQAVSHHNVCKKLKKEKSGENNNSNRKYSPIRETDSEHSKQ